MKLRLCAMGLIPLWGVFVISPASASRADSFSAEGTVFEPCHGCTYDRSRWLVNDGSFEAGTCQITPVWDCESSNDCDWIVDLVPLGLWNFDGNHVAWLGGFCDSEATEYTHICQEIDVTSDCAALGWYWMADINEGGSRITVTMDGYVIYENTLTPLDDLLEYQPDMCLLPDWGHPVELCFNYDRHGSYGDSYFMDFVEWFGGPTALEEASFSTVKSMY